MTKPFFKKWHKTDKTIAFVSFMSHFRFMKCFLSRKHSEIKTSKNVTIVTFLSHFCSSQETFKGHQQTLKGQERPSVSRKCVKKRQKPISSFLYTELDPLLNWTTKKLDHVWQLQDHKKTISRSQQDSSKIIKTKYKDYCQYHLTDWVAVEQGIKTTVR